MYCSALLNGRVSGHTGGQLGKLRRAKANRAATVGARIPKTIFGWSRPARPLAVLSMHSLSRSDSLLGVSIANAFPFAEFSHAESLCSGLLSLNF